MCHHVMLQQHCILMTWLCLTLQPVGQWGDAVVSWVIFKSDLTCWTFSLLICMEIKWFKLLSVSYFTSLTTCDLLWGSLFYPWCLFYSSVWNVWREEALRVVLWFWFTTTCTHSMTSSKKKTLRPWLYWHSRIILDLTLLTKNGRKWPLLLFGFPQKYV